MSRLPPPPISGRKGDAEPTSNLATLTNLLGPRHFSPRVFELRGQGIEGIRVFWPKTGLEACPRRVQGILRGDRASREGIELAARGSS